jgi:Carboxypeptidase regulatory-like domain
MMQFVIYAAGQTSPLTISGMVLDPSGASVPDAAMELQRPRGHTVKAVHTDVRGIFEFSALSPGPHFILVHQSGFRMWSRAFVCRFGHWLRLRSLSSSQSAGQLHARKGYGLSWQSELTLLWSRGVGAPNTAAAVHGALQVLI